MEIGEISSSSFESKISLEELFVTCLNHNNEKKLEKTIKNYLDLFTNTSLNHMPIRSRLISQPNNKLMSNRKQILHATDL